MKFKSELLRTAAALFVAAVLFSPVTFRSRVEASPLAGCPNMPPDISSLARSIFGPYAWSGGGSSSLAGGGALRDLVPPGAFVTNCVFAREYVRGNIPTDSPVLSTGHVVLPSYDARVQTWNKLTSKLGLTVLNQPPYHYGLRPGLAIGYRDGTDQIIAFAMWMAGSGRLQQGVAGTALRPLVSAQVPQ